MSNFDQIPREPSRLAIKDSTGSQNEFTQEVDGPFTAVNTLEGFEVRAPESDSLPDVIDFDTSEVVLVAWDR